MLQEQRVLLVAAAMASNFLSFSQQTDSPTNPAQSIDSAKSFQRSRAGRRKTIVIEKGGESSRLKKKIKKREKKVLRENTTRVQLTRFPSLSEENQ